MTLMIGKIIWINPNQGMLLNLQGEMIPFETKKAGPINRRLQPGMMFLFDTFLLGVQDGQRLEAINLRKIDKTITDETLNNCSKDADPKLVSEVHYYIDSLHKGVNERGKNNFTDSNAQNPDFQTTTSYHLSENEQYFRHYLSIVYRSIKRPDFQVRYSPEEALSFIGPEDVKLSERWLPENPEHKDELLAKMLSARVAEKIAQSFYRQLKFTVKDIALTQLTGSSKEWLQYDIRLNSNISIDVKNARNPMNNKIRYIDYCVPQFKYTRQGEEVIIAGVFSPYLSLNQILGHVTICSGVRGFYFLGETTNTMVGALETAFFSPKFKVEIQRRRRNGNKDSTILPPWIFDYPEEYYFEQNIWRSQLREYDRAINPPPFQSMNGFTPVPALIACGLPIPDKWGLINDAQREFITKLYKNSQNRIILPVLFLTILTDFLERVTSDIMSTSFSPKKIYTVLYRPGINSNVIGICDPLNIIWDLIETLQMVWDNRTHIHWESIASFQFKGLGLLLGVKHNSETITILAYCGGKIGGIVTCGYSPLVVGENDTCPNGKLVCNKCGYCCEKCRGIRIENEDQIWEEK